MSDCLTVTNFPGRKWLRQMRQMRRFRTQDLETLHFYTTFDPDCFNTQKVIVKMEIGQRFSSSPIQVQSYSNTSPI